MYVLSVGVVVGTTAHTKLTYMVCACTYFMVVYRLLVGVWGGGGVTVQTVVMNTVTQ